MSLPEPDFVLVARTDHFVVINKAPGVAMHRDTADQGLAMMVSAVLGQPVWPVHRLDRMTSGLVLFALSAGAAAELSAAFAAQQVSKLYLALSDHKPRKKQGRIEGGMVRSRRSSWKLTRTRENLARTEFYSASLRPGLRVFLCRPYTGKTHQIRVALKSIGAPIVGDPLYHEVVEPAPDRGYLHAWQLVFVFAGKTYRFRADPDRGALFVLPELSARLAGDWAEPFSLNWHGVSN